MTGSRALFVAGIVAAASLPLLGRSLRGEGGPRCALDGVRLDPARQVRIVDSGGDVRLLDCVDCARRWLAMSGDRPREVVVTDETTGAEVPAGKAWFVESRVLAFPVCGSRVHAFALEADARRHAEDFGGFVLEGRRRPLGPEEESHR